MTEISQRLFLSFSDFSCWACGNVTGIATSYIKNDFSLSETVAGSVLLMKMNDVAYFRANIILALVGATGFFCSSIFSINQ